MSEWFTIELNEIEGVVWPISIRKSKVISLQRQGVTVVLLFEGTDKPLSFTLSSIDAAKSLYEQCRKALGIDAF